MKDTKKNRLNVREREIERIKKQTNRYRMGEIENVRKRQRQTDLMREKESSMQKIRVGGRHCQK
jgi:hypothetical protein